MAIMGCRVQVVRDGHKKVDSQIGRGNDTYSHDTENTVSSSGNGIASTALGSREDFRGVAIEHGIHDVAAEVVRTVPSKKRFTALGGRGAIQEDTGQSSRKSERSLAANSGEFDKQTSNQSSGNTKHSNDQTVAVSEICASITKIDTLVGLNKWQKGVVKRETETNESPNSSDEAGRQAELEG